MNPLKRVEIITDEFHSVEVCALLRDCGANGYTVFPGLYGWGDRGNQRGDDISGASTNICVLSACSPEVADRIMKSIGPILDLRGGLCIITDAAGISI